MWVMMLSNSVEIGGEIINMVAKIILGVQTIALPFIFTVPEAAAGVLGFSFVLSILSAVFIEPGHLMFTVISLVFIVTSLAVKNKKKNTKNKKA
jgi:hypothetical protein